MATNQLPIIVPCHRVLGKGVSLGGFSAFGGNETKVRMLAIEGVQLPAEKLALAYEPAILQSRLDVITAKEAITEADEWKPFRSVVSWYLWRLAENKELLA